MATRLSATDVGQHQMGEAQYYHHNRPRSLVTSGGLGTMGFATPAAIGAKFAKPDADVWVVVGDGGFRMTMCYELATIAQEKIKVNIAIINNGFLWHGAAMAGIFLRQALRGGRRSSHRPLPRWRITHSEFVGERITSRVDVIP